VLRGRQDRDGVGLAGRDEVGSLERIDRDVDRGRSVGVVRGVARADLFADVEHRRLVALSFADDDGPDHVDLVHGPTHRLGGRPVRPVAVVPAHVAGGGDRSRLGDANHFQGQQLFHGPCLDRGVHRGVQGGGSSCAGRQFRLPVRLGLGLHPRRKECRICAPSLTLPGHCLAVAARDLSLRHKPQMIAR